MPTAVGTRSRKARAALAGGVLLAASLGTLVGDCYLQARRAAEGRLQAARAAESTTDPSMSMPGRMPLLQGSPAPDLDLSAVAGGKPFRLTDHRGVGPVVLVFGSFTCDLLQAEIPELGRIYRRHRGRAAFAFIGVREAGHRIPGYEFLLDEPGVVAEGAFERRRRCVGEAVALSELPLPAYLDSPDQSACSAYQAWPRRLVVVDREGRITLDLGSNLAGPWDLHRLELLLDAQAAAAGASSRRPG